MSYTKKTLISKIPKKYRESLGYYPDVIFYQHKQREYGQKLQLLSQAQFIYTDGYRLRPAGMFRFAYESFKGFLGFTNHCQTEKVQLSLQKFAFYGYLKGYQQQQLTKLQRHGLQPDNIQLVSKPRSSQTSATIQSTLIRYYLEHAECFNAKIRDEQPKIRETYKFGISLTWLKLWTEIPKLDPQNDLIISQTRDQLENEESDHPSYDFIRDSKYAQAAANLYLSKAKKEKNTLLYGWNLLNNSKLRAQQFLERALFFNSQVVVDEKELYISYYLEKNELQKALVLIEQLEPVEAFSRLVSLEQYDKAYTLFSTNKTTQFLEKDTAILAKYFDKLGEDRYEQGLYLRKNHDWNGAKILYLSSLEAKGKASELESNKSRQEDYCTHKRLYAQLLIDSDIENFDASKCQIADIIKAINLLDSCDPEVKIFHNTALARGLMRQVDYLTSIIQRAYNYSCSCYTTPYQYYLDHEKTFVILINTLERITNLLGGTRDADQKVLLGRAYFLLGDFGRFYNLPNYTPNYYENAMKANPSELAYIHRCREAFPERNEELLKKAQKLGYTESENESPDVESGLLIETEGNDAPQANKRFAWL